MTQKVVGFKAAGRTIAREVDQFGRRIQQIEVSGSEKVADALVLAVARNLGGKTIFLSRVGKPGKRRGANVGVTKRTAYRGGGGNFAVVMTGPAHLIERDTVDHTIINYRAGRLGKGKGSRSKEAKYAAKQDLYNFLFGGKGALRIGNEWRTGPFQHPGTTGKHPFEKGVREIEPQQIRIYEQGVLTALRRSFP